MNIIFGASGHAKEIDLFLSSMTLKNDLYIRTFVVDSVSVYDKNIATVTETEFMHLINSSDNKSIYSCYIGIGSGAIRRKIIDKFIQYSGLSFPNLIPKSVLDNSTNIKFGEGNILFKSVLCTVDTIIGNHNHFNLNVSISHDCRIGNYNTFSPGVRVSGNVQIGNNNFFGVGACVIDKIIIGDNVIVGAGAVVTQNLLIPGTYVGVPAKKIK